MTGPDDISGTREALEARARRALSPASPRFAPVRHHAPACARHIETTIRDYRPDAVLIEGPSDGNHLIPHLASAEPPAAFYSYFVDETGQWGEGPDPDEPDRYRCYHPFAAFSPEWAAVKTALRVGAEARFIDLPYPELLAAARGREDDLGAHDSSMLSDHKIARADAARLIVEKSGCRDFNEWWDRAFESGAPHREPGRYFRDLLLFAMLLRSPDAEPDPETDARERFMAGEIREAMEAHRRVLVVTGAYHTERLARLVDEGAAPREAAAPPGEGGIHLVPYSLNRLDEANGYASGMPHCGYYHRVWRFLEKGSEAPHLAAMEELALAVGRRLRKSGEQASFSDSLEAIVISRKLGDLRGTPPGRPELLDAMETAFVKGSSQDRPPVFRIIREVVTPGITGSLARGAPLAPIVKDFRETCMAFKLPLAWTEPKTRRLDIHRSKRHRRISRFFHQLRFHGAPYAAHEAGPDFARGEELNRVREIWKVQWTPDVEAILTECMRYGGRLPDAALNLLRERLRQNPSGLEAARLLIEALVMGLHPILSRLIRGIADWILKESDLVSLIQGLGLLHRAQSIGDALDAGRIRAFPRLLGDLFERACERMVWIGEAEKPRLALIAEGLLDLSSHVTRPEPWADRDLFANSVRRLYESGAQPLLRGAAAGILTRLGVWDAERTGSALTRVCDQAWHDAESLGDFLTGFLPSSRHALIQNPVVLNRMTEAVVSWDEEIFLNALPALRRSFTHLTPRETRDLGEAVRMDPGERDLMLDKCAPWSAGELERMITMRQGALANLATWGLGKESDD